MADIRGWIQKSPVCSDWSVHTSLSNHLVATSALPVFLPSLCAQPDAGEPSDVSQSTKHFWSLKSKHCCSILLNSWSGWPWDSKLIWKRNIYTRDAQSTSCSHFSARLAQQLEWRFLFGVWFLKQHYIQIGILCDLWPPNQKTRNCFSV